jgi:hypothetical protein
MRWHHLGGCITITHVASGGPSRSKDEDVGWISNLIVMGEDFGRSAQSDVSQASVIIQKEWPSQGLPGQAGARKKRRKEEQSLRQPRDTVPSGECPGVSL